MGGSERTYVWPTEASTTVLAKLRPSPFEGGWVQLGVSGNDAHLSRQLQTAVVAWSIQTATNHFRAELFLHGSSIRSLEYSKDGGWHAHGPPAPCEDRTAIAAFLRTRPLASPDGYEVLRALLGASAPPTKEFLRAISHPAALESSKEWDFGKLEGTLATGAPVGVKGLGSLRWSDGSRTVVLDPNEHAAAKGVEIKPAQLAAPVIWKDVGAFYLRPMTPIPFVPTDAQRNLMTDDALEDMVRMRREQATSLVRFEASPALVRMVSRKKLLPKAERALWEPWLALPQVEGASVLPREKWEKVGEVFQLPVGRDLEPGRVPRELFVLFLRCLGGLRRAVSGRLLGGDAVRELSSAWIAKGLPVELVVTELLG